MKETKSDKFYKDLQESKESRGRSKKRRFSRIIMAFDAVVILIILVIMSNRSTETIYKTANLDISNTKIRFSLTESVETNNYIFTLTFQGKSSNPFKKVLKNGLGKLIIFDNDTEVFSRLMGKGIKKLVLEGDEVRVFRSEVDKSELDSYLRDVKKMKKKKRSILNMTGQYYKFRPVITINFRDPISIPLELRHEVNL